MPDQRTQEVAAWIALAATLTVLAAWLAYVAVTGQVGFMDLSGHDDAVTKQASRPGARQAQAKRSWPRDTDTDVVVDTDGTITRFLPDGTVEVLKPVLQAD